MGEFLEDDALIGEARQIALTWRPEWAKNDTDFEVLYGSAGAILGLLALHRRTPDPALLKRARALGKALLAGRVASPRGPRAWPWRAVDSRMLAGFAHGAAGIAHALLGLHRQTGEARFLEAAREAVAYEESIFSAEWGAWTDLRPDFEHAGRPMIAWCHGAAGIGLARITGLDVLRDSTVERDVEWALTQVLSAPLSPLSSACCGNLSRVETMLVAAHRLNRPDLLDAARRLTAQVVEMAAQAGGYQLLPGLPPAAEAYAPGFFWGVGGCRISPAPADGPGAIPFYPGVRMSRDGGTLYYERLSVPLVGNGPKQTIDLFWAAHYADRTILNVLQWIRDGRLAGMPEQQEAEAMYWARLDGFRGRLAGFFRDRGFRFDLIADPPSRGGQHRPYLDAFRTLWPKAVGCYFVKHRPVNSGDPGTTLKSLRRAISLGPLPKPGAVKRAERVLIVDDVIATGRTIAVLVEKLRPVIGPAATFTVVCPLRSGYLPPDSGSDAPSKRRAGESGASDPVAARLRQRGLTRSRTPRSARSPSFPSPAPGRRDKPS